MSNSERFRQHLANQSASSVSTTDTASNSKRFTNYVANKTVENHSPTAKVIDANRKTYADYGYKTQEAYDADVKKYSWAKEHQGLSYADVQRRKLRATGDELNYLNQYGTLVGYNNLEDYNAELADIYNNKDMKAYYKELEQRRNLTRQTTHLISMQILSITRILSRIHMLSIILTKD